jgi:hypothetical protein
MASIRVEPSINVLIANRGGGSPPYRLRRDLLLPIIGPGGSLPWGTVLSGVLVAPV